MRKWIVLAGGLVAGAVAFLAAWLHVPTLTGLGPAYSAEITCACVFVSGRSPASCAGDLDSLSRRLVSVSVSPADRSVTAGTLGLVRRTARYRDGYGCALDD
jgi:hypothetical protein